MHFSFYFIHLKDKKLIFQVVLLISGAMTLNFSQIVSVGDFTATSSYAAVVTSLKMEILRRHNEQLITSVTNIMFNYFTG